jgi:AcrR family transcriptional regulator
MLNRDGDDQGGEAMDRPVPRSRSRANIERRVVEAALELAARGGFEAVRQREVAERAGVALGTLYKRFASKEELLVGVLEVESKKLASRLERDPPQGATPLERVRSHFAIATYYLVRKPPVGRAILRAVTSGGKVSDRMQAYQAQQLGQVVDALRPKTSRDEPPHGDTLSETDAVSVATILLQVWFAALVGWSGGLFDPDGVVEQVSIAAKLVLAGLRAT